MFTIYFKSFCVLCPAERLRFWPICLLDLEPAAQQDHLITTTVKTQAGDVDVEDDSTEDVTSMSASSTLLSSVSTGSEVSSVSSGSEVEVATCWACCAVQATESPPTAWPIVLRSNL